MKFSEQWLREWVNPSVNHETLVAQLTMLGLEVDAAEPVAKFQKVLVGKVLTCKPHPEADKLSVCTVDVGSSTPLDIVCGASNVREGLKVAVATIGATLPNGMEIKPVKLRGAPSEGMLCSASELGLAETSNGILELPIDAPLGQDLKDYWNLHDHTIEIDLTPNRGDCLSIRGVAREIGVRNAMPVTPVKISSVTASITDQPTIHLSAGDACPRYCGRVIRYLNPNATTPQWMQEKLRRSGLRSISPIIDVTNYVLLELGQPLHAFDAKKIQGDIHVRWSKSKEPLTLLDEKAITLDDSTLVIADNQQALGIAGIMGGLSSSVTADTRDIILESAFFSPIAVSGRARRYGLSTDSSHRFERGVDPELCKLAIERATALLVEIAGGQPGPVVIAENPNQLPKPQTVTLRASRIQRLLGFTLPATEIRDILTRLDFELSGSDSEFQVKVPSHRFDIAIEEDLIEELARIHGYDHLPDVTPIGALTAIPKSEATHSISSWIDHCVARGYNEVITYTFVDPKVQNACFPGQSALTLVNPISSELSQMRLSLWPGLLTTAQSNQSRQLFDFQLVEYGLRFLPESTLQQIPTLAGIRVGQRHRDHWKGGTRPIDFYDIKADVESLLKSTHAEDKYEFAKTDHPVLHPGQSAELRRNGKVCGYLGMLHPRLLKILDLQGPIALFELDWDTVRQGQLPQYERVSKFQSNRRDLSFLIDRSITADAILACAQENKPEILQDAFIFDVYQGKGIPENQKSMAMGLIIGAFERTLVDQEINDCLHLVLDKLKQRFDIQLRE